MKRSVVIIIMLAIFLSCNVYSLDTTLFDMRNKFFEKSEEIKPLIADSSDSVLVISLWDSCLITMTRIDAYIYMLGVFNTIEEKDISNEAVGFLEEWLRNTVNTNNLSLRSLNNIAEITDPRIEPHVQGLKDYYKELNNMIDVELSKVSALGKSQRMKRRR